MYQKLYKLVLLVISNKTQVEFHNHQTRTFPHKKMIADLQRNGENPPPKKKH